MEWITNPNVWAALITLTALEIVLGIDNIIFISIVTGRLPPARQTAARQLGLTLAVVTRLALLAAIFWMSRLSAPLFSLFERPFSLRDLVLIGGGLFLLAKSTLEIHGDLEDGAAPRAAGARLSLVSAVVQIALLDIVFSFDSVITAIGMSDRLFVMAAAIVIAVGFMLFYAGAVSRFVQRHPTLKMLALAFLILIGVALIADGIGLHIPKGYIYFAMAFAFGVEMLNLRLRRRRTS
ncbi:MAG: TerC family protein [Gammaproteobacteria bacterium]